MKKILLTSLITLLAFGTACGQAPEPEPEPMASDGIQVHGDWTVTVTNPDGTVDAVHEFENAVTGYGKEALTSILMGEIDVNKWWIVVKGRLSDDSLNCNLPAGNPSIVTYAGPGFYELHIPAFVYRDVETSGTPIKLSLSCTTTNDFPWDEPHISLVGTKMTFDSTLTTSLAPQPWTNLTRHDMDPVIEVSTYQALSFNISISFS